MNSQVIVSIQVTLIGMGLVFAILILLSIGMSLLVRATSPKKVEEDAGLPISTPEVNELDKNRAVAAAVAISLARKEMHDARPQLVPPTATVSPWQTVTRARTLNRRGPLR